MPAIYQGDKKIVDRYVGETLITRAYQGNKLIFDAYSELSGTLPLAVRSRASQILENYIIYGTDSGAGVETENLWNPAMNFEAQKYINVNGVLTYDNNYSVSDYMPMSAGTVFTISSVTTYYPSAAYHAFYDTNQNLIRTLFVGKANESNTFTTPEGCAYARFTVRTGTVDINGIMLVEDRTLPDVFVPHGYKLPITVTSNGTTTDYPVYIGDSQLGEEEYVDYEEQKVYKRTENLWNPNTPFVEGKYISGSGGLGTDIGWRASDYVNVDSNKQYTFYVNTTAAPAARHAFYDSNKQFISSINSGVQTFTTPNDAVYVRFSYRVFTTSIMLVKGSTPPESYIPYLQPTDPPVPLPDISLPQGEVTIDTEEEFKYHSTIKGRINPVHYAYRINADTAEITYLADNKSFTPAAMGSTTFDYGSWENAFFMPRPCMLKSNGKVDYYLDPNDYSKKLDGTASDIADLTYDGNVMLEFPKIWYKFEPTGDDGEGGTFHCSNVKLDNDYECWCNYDANNNEIDHFYVAAYNAVILDNKMRSLSGYDLTQENGADTTTGATEIAAARANNQNGIDEWYTYLISDHQLLTHLATLMCKHVNHQAKFGRGVDSGSTSAKRAYVTGTLNDKGLFWGDTSTGTQGVKVFGIENFYACVWKRAAGLIGTSTGYSYKLTHGTKDGSTATSFNISGSGYKTIARTKPATGYVTTMHYEANSFWIPAITGTNRYAVYHWTGNGYVLVGGGSYIGSACGSWSVILNSGVSISNWDFSSALSCKPKA